MAWVAIVVAVALLAFLGLLQLGSLGGASGSGTAVSFDSAQSTAFRVAPPGPWVLIDAEGFDLATGVTLPLNLSGLQAENCTITSLTGPLPSSLALPSFSGNLSSGLAPAWLLDLAQPSHGAELAVAVIGGTATFAVEISGGQCATGVSSLVGVTTPVVDSPVAAQAAAAAGGTAFLSAHPSGVSVDMSLIGLAAQVNSTPYPPEWGVYYTTCPFLTNSSSQATGSEFSVGVNATTGVVVPGSAFTGTCGPVSTPPPIGTNLAFGAASLGVGPGTGGTLASQGCTSGDYCYTVPIAGVTNGVTPSDFDLEVIQPNDQVLSSVVGFAIVEPSSQVLVYSTGPFAVSWLSDAGTTLSPLTSGMTIMVDVGTANPAGTGLELEAIATGTTYSGTETVPLP
jgi:hypothetical protein